MNKNQENTGLGFWLAWFLLSAGGFGIGAIFGAGMAYGSLFQNSSEFVQGAITGVVMGTIGCYSQWIVLRERVAGTSFWGLTGAIAFGLAVGALGSSDYDAKAGILLFVAIFGFGGGLLQWLILRRNVSRAAWWLVASCLGTLIGLMDLPLVVALSEAEKWTQSILMFGVVFGVGYGAITGAALVWLLRQSASGDVESLTTAQ